MTDETPIVKINTRRQYGVDREWKPKAEREAAEARRVAREAAKAAKAVALQAEYEAEMAEVQALADAAVARFVAEPEATFAFHLHDGILAEKIGEGGGPKGAAIRIQYVLNSKPFYQLATRLRLVRPIPPDKVPEVTSDVTLEEISTAQRVVDDARAKVQSITRRPETDEFSRAAEKFFGPRYFEPLQSDQITTTKASFDAMVKAAKALMAKDKSISSAKAAANADLDVARKRLRELERRSIDRTTGLPPRDVLLAIHAEVCEKDCPWDEERGTIWAEE